MDDASVCINLLDAGSGEINVPLASGEFSVDDIAGTLGEVVAGTSSKPNRATTSIFDSTGLAIQDVALARAIYEAARSQSIRILSTPSAKSVIMSRVRTPP